MAQTASELTSTSQYSEARHQPEAYVVYAVHLGSSVHAFSHSDIEKPPPLVRNELKQYLAVDFIT